MTRPLTGRMVLAIFVTGFGIIIAVNVTMAMLATGTFPGLVVENSYVASQEFDRNRAEQEALGWSVSLAHDAGGVVARITDAAGVPVHGLALTAHAARPSTDQGAQELEFIDEGAAYRARFDLPPGLWRVNLHLRGAAGATWQGEARVFVPEDRG
ncbi:FixH family protein [Paroceanicella profunda]|uniref:FixH family protein n=1 Tax=Paroceanicella profunda TaxID=2579971 RepID=A0A5B8FI52_9RHOB|nr:FixH family protein [Paroceanicella profunda]QDL92698.1 FixH family protein [Paroceanicella profunda]